MLRHLSSTLTLLLTASSVVSCSSKETHPPTDTTGSNQPVPGASGSSASDAGVTATSTCGFLSAPTTYSLPSIVGESVDPFATLTNEVSCMIAGDKLAWSLIDIDGDGRLDLVVTTTCDDATVGVNRWFVYFGTATGFAATGTPFTIPSTPSPGCATVSLFDVDGDLRPDYVETSLCNDATVGSSRWLAYLSTPTGFSTAATSYALPPGMSAGAFTTTGTTSASCGTGQNSPAFQLMDINGDEKLDFVVTKACDDASVGTTSWRVYLGSATGASPAPTTFSLPTNPLFTQGAFAATTGSLQCGNSVSFPTFSLVDFDDDGKPDLLVTQDCNDATVGSTTWLLFHNAGNGFEASVTVALPPLPEIPTNAFPALDVAGTCKNGGGTPSYSVLDANGDGLPDLLVTSDCTNTQTGATYWELFAGNGATFTSAYQAFTLPAAIGATITAPQGLAGTASCGAVPPRPTYVSTYLADNTLDLVLTVDCTDTTVGGTNWLVLPASCPP